MTGLLTPNTFLQARYVITRKLGQGGMGAVYQAQDARLQGKLWAIKEMSDAQLTDPAERANAIASFRREAQLLATLDHTNLPKVADFFEEGGKQYLVMDFVEGQTLEQIVAATPGFLPEPTVLAWIEQLCDVLEYLHARQPPIVFRDLKPANIMLMREGKIKLIDFGIARFFKAGKTKDTAQYGTMGYAAPEQFGTGQTDARSDIYSLGVVLHYLLTKFDPALTPFNLPPVCNINPLISAQTDAVIVRATRSASVERFQWTREFKQALYQMPSAPVQPTQLPMPTPQPPMPSISAPRPSVARTQPTPSVPMILVPAGEFVMGSKYSADERPPHKVYIDAFYIDRYPVTNAEYKKFVDATGYRVPDHWINRQIPYGKENHPVVYVSWDDADMYARWAGKRLPTEAEWEKAARGTDGRDYPWGNQFAKSRCNSDESKIGDTTPVDSYSPQGDSPYGVSDMVGNTWEWCADWYDEYYYAKSPPKNPQGPASGSSRVRRGGAWNRNEFVARASFRNAGKPDDRFSFVGFRCAK
jgi:serine/threonine-protein kinase